MAGAGLDIEKPDELAAYLRETGRVERGERILSRGLPGGVSNRTVLVEFPDRSNDTGWVLKQALPKLRVAVDWFSDPRRIDREAEGLRWLARLAPPGTITPLLFHDPAQDLLAMAAVPSPHENWKAMLLVGRVEMGHARQFGELLGRVHCASWEKRGEVAAAFEDRSFFESLRVEPYYSYSAGRAPEAAAFITRLIDDTRAARFALVHGDYSPKNVLVRDGRLVLLDHEVIHWGDPAFDVGFALTHFLSKARHSPSLARQFEAAALEFWRAYRLAIAAADWAADVEERSVRHTLACLLARVVGRSPLEYLDTDQRAAQREVATRLMASPPQTMETLARAALPS